MTMLDNMVLRMMRMIVMVADDGDTNLIVMKTMLVLIMTMMMVVLLMTILVLMMR